MPTSLVSSYAQSNWLIDKTRLGQRLPPRVVLHDLWKVQPSELEEAQNDATIIALDDQCRASVGIVTGGEMRRESYSNHFANAVNGIDIDNPGEAIDRTGAAVPVESPELVASRIEEALKYMSPARLVVAPDCGMKYLSRDVAFAKLSNMVAGRNLVAG